MKATYGASVNDKVMNIQRELNSYYFGLLCPTLTIDLYEKHYDPGRIRTCNLLIRSQTRSPLRHRTSMKIKIFIGSSSKEQTMLGA